MTVLGALVVAMTVTSGLLMLLEPGPSAPRAGVPLQTIDRTGDQPAPQAMLFQTEVPEVRWNSIVIHDSRTPHGSAQTLHHVHQQLGRGGLGNHFVIDNGPGADDGKVEVGFRWSSQAPGAFFADEAVDWPDAIGICLIGDGQSSRFSDAQLHQLVWLVQNLQKRYGIPRSSVYIQIGSRTADSTFPEVWFRQQLISR
ncbi:MAG: hypothetical protein Kow00105_19120 [Phycisphaeraceae bacterium]